MRLFTKEGIVMKLKQKQRLFALGKEVKAQGHFSRVYEKGYRRGYHKGLEDGTVEIHSHIDVYHFPEEFQVRSE